MLNCLMHLASGMRRQYLGRATGYDVGLMPFDRALNIWRADDRSAQAAGAGPAPWSDVAGPVEAEMMSGGSE
jgi:hypothetical protein